MFKNATVERSQPRSKCKALHAGRSKLVGRRHQLDEPKPTSPGRVQERNGTVGRIHRADHEHIARDRECSRAYGKRKCLAALIQLEGAQELAKYPGNISAVDLV